MNRAGGRPANDVVIHRHALAWERDDLDPVESNPRARPPELMVIVPISFSEMVSFEPLKSRMPVSRDVLAVTEVALMTMLEEASRLPILFPRTLKKPPTRSPVGYQ